MAKVLVNFQDDFLQEIDKIAELEHRTRSSLIREALRRYLSQFKNESPQQQQKENDIQLKTPIPNKIIYPVSKAS
jgi:metal-responsive CopG/Arc/MetJ family transcriptional regulator